MKLTSFFFLMTLVHASANGFSQKITLSLKKATLKDALKSIEKQSDYIVWYNDEQMNRSLPVTVELRGVVLEEALNACLAEQPFSYNIRGKNIVLVDHAIKQVDETSKQNAIVVRGTVVNQNGEPVVVSIVVKGSNRGATSNEFGEFILHGVELGDTLEITGIGVTPLRLRITSTVMRIQVSVSAQPLDETVVKGYYSTTRRLNTGSVSVVKSADIQKQPVSNPLEAISGRMAGVYVQQSTGTSGGGFNIEIRGLNSLRRTLGANNGNQPLFIVDGVQISSSSPDQNTGIANGITPLTSPLNAVNPSDIARIEILKDADATAIYGSRGANGVVLITTKKGKAGKTKIDLTVYSGVAKVSNQMDLLNSEQYMAMRREGFANDASEPQSYDYDMVGGWDTTRYTNWQKEFIGGTAHVTRGDVSLSGGSERTQFLVGVGFFRQSTVYPGDFADRKGSMHLHVNHASENKRFNASIQISYVLNDNRLPSADPTSNALKLPPTAPAMFNADGALNWAVGSWPIDGDNPYTLFLRTYQSRTNNLIANSVLAYELLPHFILKTSLSYNASNFDQTSLYPIKSQNPAWSPTGGSTSAFQRYNSWIAEPQVEYQKNILSGNLSLLFGATFQQNLTDARSYNSYGYTSDELLYDPRFAGGTYSDAFSYAKYKYTALFGRINYNFDDKYLINFTGRRDGSSRFGSANRFANFGAVGVAWIFASEPVVQRLMPFLSHGKLRVSYGTTGSDQIPDYGYLNTYTATANPYNGTGGLLVNRLFNADYAWELTRKSEAGVEFGFLRDKVFVGANFYRNRSSNQLVGYPLPTLTGQSSLQFFNLPATVQNTGWEFELTSVNLERRNFKWTTSFNFTLPKNRLIAYPDIDKSSYANTYTVGQSIYLQKAYHFVALDRQTGTYILEDLNKDDRISWPDDLQGYKTVEKHYYGGITNGFRYRKFQLDIFVQFVKQTGFNYQRFFSNPGAPMNQPVSILDRWQTSHTSGNTQKFTANYGTDAYFAYSNLRSSDATISDASFVRLRNVYASFELPTIWMSKLKAQSAKVFLQGQNLVTVTDYLGLDPETQSFSFLPTLRILTAGIQITL